MGNKCRLIIIYSVTAVIFLNVFCPFLNAEILSVNTDNKTSFTAEENYSSGDGIYGKMTAVYGCFEFNVMDFREDPSCKKEDKTVCSFYSPLFTSGRVRKKGLFREYENPSSLYAGSDTYNDESIITKDAELERNGNWGLVLQYPELITLYALADENDSYRIMEKGGGVNLQFSDDFEISAVFSESVREEGADDSWYRERNMEYGEKICHCALRAVQSGRFVRNSLSGGLSSGRCFKTGKYFRYHPELELGAFTLFLLFSCSDINYRKTERGYPSVKLRRGVKGEYEAGRNFVFESGYNIDIYHPEYLSEVENRIAEKIFFKAGYDAGSVFLKFDAARKNYSEETEYLSEDSYGINTGIRGDQLSFSVNPEFSYINNEADERGITLESSVTDGKRKIKLRYRRVEGARVETAVKLRPEYNGEHVKMYSEAGYETVDEKGVNLKSVFRYSAGVKISY